MSEFAVPIVRVGFVRKHPNADTLSTTEVLGETTIFKIGDFKEGDFAVYVPVDAVVPPTVPGTEFLGDHRRIRAKRLRGVYSEGLLLPYKTLPIRDFTEGSDVADLLGIKKHEDQVPESWNGGAGGGAHTRGSAEQERKPDDYVPVYDVESYKKHRYLDILRDPIVVTEKLHGTNARYVISRGKFYVGSRNRWWRDPDERPGLRERLSALLFRVSGHRLGKSPRGHKPNLYWQVAKQYDLEAKLRRSKRECLAFYGEIYGQVQDLKYDAAPGQVWFRVFDVYDSGHDRWLNWNEMGWTCHSLGLDVVPVLYTGTCAEQELAAMVEGKSIIASHFREGVVLKPLQTRVDQHFGRVILKWISETYKLRKGGTELQ